MTTSILVNVGADKAIDQNDLALFLGLSMSS